MDIDFTITYTSHFDLDQAEADFRDMHYWNPKANINKLLYDAVDQNITWPMGVSDLPDEVMEIATNALIKRIGGIQIEMELD